MNEPLQSRSTFKYRKRTILTYISTLSLSPFLQNHNVQIDFVVHFQTGNMLSTAGGIGHSASLFVPANQSMQQQTILNGSVHEVTTPRNDTSNNLYCYCKQKYDETQEMIACDACNDWFHFKCVGITVATEDEWFCRDCQKTGSLYTMAGAATQSLPPSSSLHLA